LEIRNVAIIAHVDHGKTTLVDALLKQTHTFRSNQKEMTATLIMDSYDLEKEKGITILAKNTSVFYKNTKINIIDTPGHADFGGEVERVLNMASAAILLVDAAEGPLPQTKFVLKKALIAGLKVILVINKIDKKDAQPLAVVKQVENLFLELAEDDSSLEFVTLYAVGREGKAFYQLPKQYDPQQPGNLEPLFETILKEVPNSACSEAAPFQLLISTLDYDNYVGKLCIGKVNQGKLKKNEEVALVDDNKIIGRYKVNKLYTFTGLTRQEVEIVKAGDIVAIAGIQQLTIGQTVTHPDFPFSLPKITVEDPTIKITIGPNTSPFAGKDGKFCTSRQIKERLLREKETNLGLKIDVEREDLGFVVYGRGELHLAVLLENMRREGFEMEISQPQVIYKTINGIVCEPFEELTVDIDQQYVGVVSEELGKRKGQLLDMLFNSQTNQNRLIYKISEHNLLGLRSILLTKTRGTVLMSTYFLGYYPKTQLKEKIRNGALVAVKSGVSLSFGLANAQERGILFVGPAEEIYEGMVVGLASRDFDIEVNVCKAKKQTNVRSETADIAIQLTPPVRLTLEQALDFINDDELLEITPSHLRIRKRYLDTTTRRVKARLLGK